jgi:hypothetical protein
MLIIRYSIYCGSVNGRSVDVGAAKAHSMAAAVSVPAHAASALGFWAGLIQSQAFSRQEPMSNDIVLPIDAAVWMPFTILAMTPMTRRYACGRARIAIARHVLRDLGSLRDVAADLRNVSAGDATIATTHPQAR